MPLRLSFLTLASAFALAAAPNISGVYNAASWLPPSLPNSGVAQGAIFTVTGSGLGPSTLQQVQSYPLPTTAGLAGTTIQVNVGGVTEACIMVYTSATQVAAILPSATPVGTGTLTLSYQGASGSIAIQVQAADFGTFSLNEGGTGPAVVTDSSYTPITALNPAHPGETLILWGTGLGAISGNETEPPAQQNLNTGVQVLVGNQPATVSYGGRGSSPGLDQINFVVPSGVKGCRTSIAVAAKGITGNLTFMAVAPSGQATCGDEVGALTTASLQAANTSGSLSIGAIDVERVGTGNDKLTATFGTYPVNSLVRSFVGSFGPSLGSCTVYEGAGATLQVTDPVQPTYLDAGPALTLTGPAGTKTIDATSTGSFSETLATQPGTYLQPGSYSISSSGGANVGAFTWNLTLPANVVRTNLPSEINLSQDLTLTWSGGDAFPLVTIFGYNGVPLTSSTDAFSEFVCNAVGSAGQFTIPSAILQVIPPAGYGAHGVKGIDLQLAGTMIQDFTAPGIDVGVFTIYESSGGIIAIQ